MKKVLGVLPVLILCIVLKVNTAKAAVLFSDDFSAGLDSAKWVNPGNNGGLWYQMTSGGNGFIDSTNSNSQFTFTNIYTSQNDLSDFTFTWDAKFNSVGYEGDQRNVYFRTDGVLSSVGYGTWPRGYMINIGVRQPLPYLNDSVYIGKMNQNDFVWYENNYFAARNYWDLASWYHFKLDAAGNDFGLKWWKDGDAEPLDWIITVTDSDASIYGSGKVGFGNFWQASTYIDNVLVQDVVPEPATISLLGLGLIGVLFRRKKA